MSTCANPEIISRKKAQEAQKYQAGIIMRPLRLFAANFPLSLRS
jgi:hypothetical protein